MTTLFALLGDDVVTVEDFFREAAAAWGDMEPFVRINEKYRLDMDFDSVPELCQRFGLTRIRHKPDARHWNPGGGRRRKH